ncbi:DUF956 family protein [Companilactobacillus mishanensis]|uniref:DUF956 family protein n=1 Tax=Companilactobacillus mishanensis TaxID=2486008 RepID=A0ABW9P6B1_9LACO|nr:DUF956 family protein [Companilactobacillus mishanensis]MQS44808.1 DUF956 family protein [Companilactobacillus mishanensis]MQS89323.1 DUF956 family protein [Companilactobacillus mishanensis]
MVESLNKKSELVITANSHMGMTTYGKIMIGDKAFEFYNDRDKKDFIQIPWDQVDYVVASIMFHGKWIPRYGLKTKKDGMFSFSSKDPKRVLRAIREHIPADHIVQSLTFWQVVKRGLTSKPAIFSRKNKKK